MFDFKGFINLFYFWFKPFYCLNSWHVVSKTRQKLVLVKPAFLCTWLPVMPWQSAGLTGQTSATKRVSQR
jgi:hypothetical protein